VLPRLAISCVLCALALPTLARTRPHYGGALHVETEDDAWQRPDGVARRLVFDGLTRIDADGAVQPALATGWETDSGTHRWLFRLRTGVHFHDGTPLTSTAVAASLNLSCNGNCPWTTVHTVGSDVVFTGDAALPNLPALLADDQFLIALAGEANSNIGTGPFQVSGFSNGALTLNASESCWQGRPFADAVEIRAHRAARDQGLDLSVGRADVVEVPVEMIRQAQQQKLSLTISSPVELLAMEVSDNNGALANPMLRAALAASIDRAALSSVIFQKQGVATVSILPQTVSGFSFLFSADRDLNKARELKGGLTAPALTMQVDGDGVLQLAAQRIVLNLREAGFNAVVAASAGHADLILRTIPLEGGEPAAVLENVMHSFGSPGVSPDTTAAALYQVEREFLDRHTLIPLVDLPRAYAVGPRVRDLQLDAEGMPALANASLEDAP
jgi:peptide/nickel transport system substrate-binding protein